MTRMKKRSPALLRIPIFYGWVIVFIVYLANLVNSGMGGYGFSLFIGPMTKELGWSRTAISGVTLVSALVGTIIAPLVGIATDRKHGPRMTFVVAGLLSAVTFYLASRVHSVWQFYLTFGAMWSVAGSLMGQQVVGTAVVSKWFVRLRGRAIALTAMGISSGGVVIAPIAGLLIAAFGWRQAWLLLGLGIAFIIVPAGLMLRRRPEDMGLLPDGEKPAGDPSTGAASAPAKAPGSAPRLIAAQLERSLTLREALRTSSMWLLMVAQAMGGIALGAVLFHQAAYMQDKGFSPAVAATMVTVVAGAALSAKLPLGILTERVHVRYLATGILLLAGFSLYLLIGATSMPMLIAYALIYGFAEGGFGTLMRIAWANYFGREHLGSIMGTVLVFTRWTGGMGPFVAGVLYDIRGDYTLSFVLLGLAWILGGVMVLFARPPRVPALDPLATS